MTSNALRLRRSRVPATNPTVPLRVSLSSLPASRLRPDRIQGEARNVHATSSNKTFGTASVMDGTPNRNRR